MVEITRKYYEEFLGDKEKGKYSRMFKVLNSRRRIRLSKISSN